MRIFVFDARSLPNPYWDPALRALTGRDADVIRFLEAQRSVPRLLEDILQFVAARIPEHQAANRRYLTIAIGCTGGRHRSVYLAERVAERLAQTIPSSLCATIRSAKCAPSRAPPLTRRHASSRVAVGLSSDCAARPRRFAVGARRHENSPFTTPRVMEATRTPTKERRLAALRGALRKVRGAAPARMVAAMHPPKSPISSSRCRPHSARWCGTSSSPRSRVTCSSS
jgi:hypothetical protein